MTIHLVIFWRSQDDVLLMKYWVCIVQQFYNLITYSQASCYFTQSSCLTWTCCIFNSARKNVLRSTCRQTIQLSWSVGLFTLYKRPFFVTINSAYAVSVLDPLASLLFHTPFHSFTKKHTDRGREKWPLADDDEYLLFYYFTKILIRTHLLKSTSVSWCLC